MEKKQVMEMEHILKNVQFAHIQKQKIVHMKMENVVNVEQQNQITKIQEMDKTTQTTDKTMATTQTMATQIMETQIMEIQVESHFHKQVQVAL